MTSETFTPSIIPDMIERNAKEYAQKPAYRQWSEADKNWIGLTWQQFYETSRSWQKAIQKSGIKKGDRIAVLMPNSINAALCDISILSRGAVPVPLHAVDTPASSSYILNNSEARILFVPKTLRWNAMAAVCKEFPYLELVVTTGNDAEEATKGSEIPVVNLSDWVNGAKDFELSEVTIEPSDLAAIVYTSGTTGKPKGVMLTHGNIVSNVVSTQGSLEITTEDLFLSFLPFSHTFERTVTYYLAMYNAAEVAFARSVLKLAEDLKTIRPTVFVSVPRVYEQFYSRIQNSFRSKGALTKALFEQAEQVGWRRFCRENGLAVTASSTAWLDSILWPQLEKKICVPVREVFGGRLRIAIAGGAALNGALGHFYCAMGIPILQGYGLTETSPVICINQKGCNNPITVGKALPGLEVRLGEMDELQVKGPSIMKGYWKLPEQTADVFTEDGWFKTGDQADFSDAGRIRIKGRIKEIIVTSTGEKIPPTDLELAIQADPLFEQVMAIGEGRPFITALVVVNQPEWEKFAASLNVDPNDPATMMRRDVRLAAIRRLKKAAGSFPQYGVPRNVSLMKEHWTVDNGCLTVTMKLRRKVIQEKFKDKIEELYTTPQNK